MNLVRHVERGDGKNQAVNRAPIVRKRLWSSRASIFQKELIRAVYARISIFDIRNWREIAESHDGLQAQRAEVMVGHLRKRVENMNSIKPSDRSTVEETSQLLGMIQAATLWGSL